MLAAALSIADSATSSVQAKSHSAAPAAENFIPVRKADLLELLCTRAELSDAEREKFRLLAQLIQARINHKYHELAETLKTAYAPFDPDSDTRARPQLSAEHKAERLDLLFDRFIWLLKRANFQRLSRAHLETAMEAMTDWGVNVAVDFESFERLEVFARGDCIGRRSRRRLLNGYRLEEVELPVYQRLVVMFRLNPHHQPRRNVDTRSVYIKFFKDIPHMDLEMLLPGTGVRMSLFDRGKIVFPTLTGVALTGWKLMTAFALATVFTFYGFLAFLGLVGGTIGYGVRSYFGYLNTKQKYQLNLTESLYYQNLDNNAGVILRLIDEAEEQECRETMLAYYFLWKHAEPAGWSEEQLDRTVEVFVFEVTGCRADFELGDALEKLRRFGLVSETGHNQLRATPIDQALARMDQAWDRLFNHQE